MTQIIITVDDNGQVKVTGPLQQKIICLGILELAKTVIANYKESNILMPDFDTVQKLNS